MTGLGGRRLLGRDRVNPDAVALWSLTAPVQGLGCDATLRVQALGKELTGLANDSFLQTPPRTLHYLFADLRMVLRCIGLRHAALTLMVLFKIWLFAAAWTLIRALFNARPAFVAVVTADHNLWILWSVRVLSLREDWLKPPIPGGGARLSPWLFTLTPPAIRMLVSAPCPLCCIRSALGHPIPAVLMAHCAFNPSRGGGNSDCGWAFALGAPTHHRRPSLFSVRIEIGLGSFANVGISVPSALGGR